jgi:hypothetical protein
LEDGMRERQTKSDGLAFGVCADACSPRDADLVVLLLFYY